MIRVDRSRVPEPAALAATRKGKTERQRVLAEYRSWLAAQQGSQKASLFSYRKFNAYRHRDVKEALAQLFHGKCAYCESRYAGTQPVDVEHWRPKAEVHEIDPQTGAERVVQGYFWLASTWSNLFPSCIDCNRSRDQIDYTTKATMRLGKANQFPVEKGGRFGPPGDGSEDSTGTEKPLLLNPCDDDPQVHLRFADGVVVPASAGDEKAIQSIRVYALNRADLAIDRLGVQRLIEQRLRTIETLVEMVDGAAGSSIENSLRDLISHEINSVLEMGDSTQPFAGMARQIIKDNAPLLTPLPTGS
jgi:uncharacterized protein (TIGR02646 family)